MIVILGSYTALRLWLFLESEADAGTRPHYAASAGPERPALTRLTGLLRPPAPLGTLVSLDERGEVAVLSAEDITWYVGTGETNRILPAFSETNRRIGEELQGLAGDLQRLRTVLPASVSTEDLQEAVNRGWKNAPADRTPRQGQVARAPSSISDDDLQKALREGWKITPPEQTPQPGLAQSLEQLDRWLQNKESLRKAAEDRMTQLVETLKRLREKEVQQAADAAAAVAKPAVPPQTSPAARPAKEQLAALDTQLGALLATLQTTSGGLPALGAGIESLGQRIADITWPELALKINQIDQALAEREKETAPATRPEPEDQRKARQKRLAQAEAKTFQAFQEFKDYLSAQPSPTPSTTPYAGGRGQPVVSSTNKDQGLKFWPGISALLTELGSKAKEWDQFREKTDDTVKKIAELVAQLKPLLQTGSAPASPPAACPCKAVNCGQDSANHPEKPGSAKTALEELKVLTDLIAAITKSLETFESSSLFSIPEKPVEPTRDSKADTSDLAHVLAGLKYHYHETRDPLSAYHAFSSRLSADMRETAGPLLLGSIQDRLGRWKALYDKQVATIAGLAPPHKMSFFLISPAGLLIDMAFWSLLGVLTNLLLHAAEFRRRGEYDGRENVVGYSKLFYGPVLAVVLGLSLAVGLINLGDYQLRVWIMPLLAFLFGYASRRTARVIDRLSDKVLSVAGGSLEEPLGTAQKKMLHQMETIQIEGIPTLRDSLKARAMLELGAQIEKLKKSPRT